MIDYQQVRELFDELVELSVEEQTRRLEALRKESTELAEKLSQLLDIGRQDDVRFITKASKLAITATLEKAETQVLLNTEVGRFTLVEEIGRGGVGVVFRAVREEGDLKHVVAVKMLQAGQTNQKSIDRFLRERAFLANLKHPNICRFIDSGMSEFGSPFVVMELIEGRDILSYARENCLSIEQRLDLFKQVLQGVEFAHQNLIIHRDLKPSNIIVDHLGVPKSYGK